MEKIIANPLLFCYLNREFNRKINTLVCNKNYNKIFFSEVIFNLCLCRIYLESQSRSPGWYNHSDG